MRSFRAIHALGLGLLMNALSGCQDHDRAPPPVPTSSGGNHGSGGDRGIVIDGSVGGPPTCGGQTLQAITHPPLLYFVIDRSGSMGEAFDTHGTTKYAAALTALGVLLDEVGARVRYGAAIYPATDLDSSCQPGFQMFPPTLGDALASVPAGGRGPILRELLNRLSAYRPGGATPTSATLDGLRPRIIEFAATGDATQVVLVTDGAPNCNAAVKCDSSSCIPDIEAAITTQGSPCGQPRSCCDASFGANAGANCIDGDATEAAVRALFEANVRTFVVGLPGSEAYAKTLDRLAVAGGSARVGTPRYYAAGDSDALSTALLEIGGAVTIPCEVGLEQSPDNPALVNVYFDGELVPRDAQNGWDYAGDTALTLGGSACQRLQAGAVHEVQIAYGCETIVR